MAKTRQQLSPALGTPERNFVLSITMKYLKDEDAAQDATQDALLLAHRNRHSFRGDSRFSTWLYRVAATTALMHLRSKRRRWWEVLESLPAGETSAIVCRKDTRPTPAEYAANAEAVQLVKRRVRELGPKYDDVFWLRYLEGFTETEIASRLQLRLTTVKTRSYRARLAVRDTLVAHAS